MTLDAKIRRQVEYYFADFNLMRDQFLKNEIKLSKEAGNDGFVSLDLMLKFNKLAQLTTDKEKILEAITCSKLVEVNEAKTGIRRNPENKLPIDDEIYRAGLKARTCYIEGFPRDGDLEKAGAIEHVQLSEIHEYFEKLDCSVETIAMRRIKKAEKAKLQGRFTGSIFVTFTTQAEAEKFINIQETEENKELVKFRNEFELKKMTKQMYWSLQNAEHDAKKRGGNVEAAVEAAKQAVEKSKPVQFAEGICLKFSGVTDATVRREDLKEWVIGKDGAVEYVSFESGKSEGLILLNLEHGKKAGEILGEDKKDNVKGCEVSFEVAGEADFDIIQTEFLAFKKRMDQLKLQGGKKGKFNKRNKNNKNRKNFNDRNNKDDASAKNTRKRFHDSDDEGAAKDENKENEATKTPEVAAEVPAKVAKTEEVPAAAGDV